MPRKITPFAAIGLAAAIAAGPSVAQEFREVSSREGFMELVQGTSLTRMGISLTVTPGGAIEGRAFGGQVTGSWRWEGSYFCREMSWGSRTFEDNCQEVLTDGETVRFIADRGAGDSADLNLQ